MPEDGEFVFEESADAKEDVYPPKEDSFLLSKAVSKFAKGRFLDLGCGSGIQGIYAAKAGRVNEVVFADIYDEPLRAAKTNLEKAFGKKVDEAGCMNGMAFAFVKTNLFSNLGGEKFDSISFNPPYLPTNSDEKLGGKINLAFDGGIDGRKTLDAFLDSFESHLNKGGVLLLLNSSLSNNEKTVEILKKKGFTVSIDGKADFFFEHLIAIVAEK
jgi:release factor glutamine methyltransferase